VRGRDVEDGKAMVVVLTVSNSLHTTVQCQLAHFDSILSKIGTVSKDTSSHTVNCSMTQSVSTTMKRRATLLCLTVASALLLCSGLNPSSCYRHH
jgi:hypothetical protein